MKTNICFFLVLTMLLMTGDTVFAAGNSEEYDFSTVEVGDIISFGSYEQDNDLSNGPEPVKWLVLEKKEDSILVISLYGLESRPYNAEWVNVSWNICTLRAWLNKEFLSAAFSADEQAMIPTLMESEERNTDYSQHYVESSWSKVFLLSITEAAQYFLSDVSRQCELTTYAKAQGNYTNANKNTCWWWLRSSGAASDFAALVNTAGGIDTFGGLVSTVFPAVRPAMWINLSGKTEGPVDIVDAQAGDIILFGGYEQDNNELNGTEPIEWLVLTREEDRILAVTRYALDRQPYNTEKASVTWENCTLRSWLNKQFLDMAFTEEEQRKIMTVKVSAYKNPDSSTDPGNDTVDQIFLLSIPEVDRFCDFFNTMCIPTIYAEAQGCYVYSGTGTCEWWLRSPGHYYDDNAAGVYTNGSVNSFGHAVNDNYHAAVRPALWIKLDA